MEAPLPTLRFSRVLVALGAVAANRPALDTGIGLAAAVGAALEALFVEDANLVRLGALPFASETSAITGACRMLAVGEMERAMRVEAARQRQLLAGAATRRDVAWSFAVTRGELLAEAIAREADLIVLGALARSAASVPEPFAPGPMAALFDASPAAVRGLAATTQLARALSSELIVLVPAGNSAPQRAARKHAREWLANEQVRGRALPLALDQRALIAEVRSRRTALLALPAPALSEWPIDLAALIANLACPLVIAR